MVSLSGIINAVRGFKTAYANIKGLAIMRMFKKGLFNSWMYGARIEVSFIKEQTSLYS
ncbi:transposase [Legionella steelei]|uniref:Transposase n=1 Tax=Legionella steelei TaxID=947033 RepID=A0A0W0ZML6_9GAMM|nr:transposase [Legionella steelei]